MKTIVELLIVFVLSALLGTSAKSAIQIKGLQILSIKIRDAQSLTSRTADLFDDENAALDSLKNTSGGKLLFAIEGNQIKVFPNPASDNVTISYHLNAYSHAQIQLLDMQGRILKEISLLPSSNQVNFSVTDLAKAVYNYRYIVNNTITENGKFIKD